MKKERGWTFPTTRAAHGYFDGDTSARASPANKDLYGNTGAKEQIARLGCRSIITIVEAVRKQANKLFVMTCKYTGELEIANWCCTPIATR